MSSGCSWIEIDARMRVNTLHTFNDLLGSTLNVAPPEERDIQYVIKYFKKVLFQ